MQTKKKSDRSRGIESSTEKGIRIQHMECTNNIESRKMEQITSKVNTYEMGITAIEEV